MTFTVTTDAETGAVIISAHAAGADVARGIGRSGPALAVLADAIRAYLPVSCPICGTPVSRDSGLCDSGHDQPARLAFLAAEDFGPPAACPICNLPGVDDETRCPAGHTTAELADWASYSSHGDHTPECEWFEDMDGSSRCTCGGEPCDSGFDLGPASDPYGVSCEYIRRGHPKDAAGHLLHRGRNPLPGPGPEPQYIEWTGGGTCAGDPLPHTITRHLGPGYAETA